MTNNKNLSLNELYRIMKIASAIILVMIVSGCSADKQSEAKAVVNNAAQLIVNKEYEEAYRSMRLNMSLNDLKKEFSGFSEPITVSEPAYRDDHWQVPVQYGKSEKPSESLIIFLLDDDLNIIGFIRPFN